MSLPDRFDATTLAALRAEADRIASQDMARAMAFYRDGLSLSQRFETPVFTEVSAGPTSLALQIGGGGKYRRRSLDFDFDFDVVDGRRRRTVLPSGTDGIGRYPAMDLDPYADAQLIRG